MTAHPCSEAPPAAERCALRLDASGLTADGEPLAVPAAVARCTASAGASIEIADDAPAAAVAELVATLARVGLAVQSRRNARRRDPSPTVRELVADRCLFRAWACSSGAPPATAVVGDAWAYVETPQGRIVGKRRFRTLDEARTYVRAALQRALERAGHVECD